MNRACTPSAGCDGRAAHRRTGCRGLAARAVWLATRCHRAGPVVPAAPLQRHHADFTASSHATQALTFLCALKSSILMQCQYRHIMQHLSTAEWSSCLCVGDTGPHQLSELTVVAVWCVADVDRPAAGSSCCGMQRCSRVLRVEHILRRQHEAEAWAKELQRWNDMVACA
jgi:hypothetical protein